MHLKITFLCVVHISWYQINTYWTKKRWEKIEYSAYIFGGNMCICHLFSYINRPKENFLFPPPFSNNNNNCNTFLFHIIIINEFICNTFFMFVDFFPFVSMKFTISLSFFSFTRPHTTFFYIFFSIPLLFDPPRPRSCTVSHVCICTAARPLYVVVGLWVGEGEFHNTMCYIEERNEGRSVEWKK